MHTITFYSYKGGVGRSLALANIAKRLSEFGKTVCIIDFDLEAPGLPYKFNSPIVTKIESGIVDYIYSFTNEGILPVSIKDYSINVNLSPQKKSVILIPAGDVESPNYWKRLSSINWYDLLYDNNGLSFFLDMKEKIRNEINPDFLLIDSRTGISEMSGITISLLADEVVILAANNKENLSGARKIIQSISKPENSILGTPPKTTFVLSRIPFTEKPEDRAKERLLITKIKKEFSDIYKDDIVIIHSDRELEENEKLKISNEFEEGFSEISKDYLKLFEILTRKRLTEEEIEKFNKIKAAERQFSFAMFSINQIEKIKLVTNAIELNETADYYLYRASLYLNNKEFEKSLNDFKNVIKIDKNNFEANLGISDIYYWQKKYKESLNILDTLSNHHQNSSNIYFKKALIYDKLGDKEKEIENYYKALEIDPSDEVVYNNLANHYRLEKQYEKALELIFRALQLNPKHPVSFTTLAEIYAETGKINEFYLNLELAFVNKTPALIESISEEKIYKRFFDDERFKALLEKYNISITELIEK